MLCWGLRAAAAWSRLSRSSREIEGRAALAMSIACWTVRSPRRRRSRSRPARSAAEVGQEVADVHPVGGPPAATGRIPDHRSTGSYDRPGVEEDLLAGSAVGGDLVWIHGAVVGADAEGLLDRVHPQRVGVLSGQGAPVRQVRGQGQREASACPVELERLPPPQAAAVAERQQEASPRKGGIDPPGDRLARSVFPLVQAQDQPGRREGGRSGRPGSGSLPSGRRVPTTDVGAGLAQGSSTCHRRGQPGRLVVRFGESRGGPSQWGIHGTSSGRSLVINLVGRLRALSG